MPKIFTSIYVRRDGNDDGTGSQSSPFATIARARNEVRKISAKMDGDIVVQIGEGVYPQEKTLVFDERDSGQNGGKVIYRGEGKNFPVLSGGKKVTEWESYEKGIWRSRVEGLEMIREFYVNGKKQRLARFNTRVKILSFYHPADDPSKNIGIVLDRKILEPLSHREDLMFRYTVAWMCYFSKCEGIVPINDKEWAVILQPAFHMITTRKFNSPTERTSIYIENAYELIDTPGEFYYDAHEGYLYYMPEQDVDLQTAECYIPVLEHLIHLCGSDLAHKVHDLTFENLHFAHAAYLYPLRFGFNSTQAQSVSTMTGEGELFFTPSNITLDAAENISFINNDFSGLGAVALGLHNGVNNTRIIGNTFYDIKDSAITVGLLTHDYIDEADKYYDLAHKASVNASAFSGIASRPEKAVDDNIEGGWRADTGKPEWIQYDLGTECNVGEVAFYLRQGRVTEVLLSRNADFTERVRLRQNECREVIRRQSYNISDTTLTKYDFLSDHPGSGQKYRYVRAVCSDDAWVCDTRIFDYDRKGIPLKEVCKNTFINNNYFTHVADYYWSSPAITAYYVDSLTVSHNYFNYVAYTAISCGWGWDANRNSVTCRNNRITDNFIKDCTMECYDGGGIYTLGNQPGSVVSGNYIYGQHYPTAALYPDIGSSGFLWTDNVTEDIGKYFYAAIGTRDYLATDNYTSADIVQIDSDPGFTLENTHVFPKFLPDAAARIIMENAGLEDSYVGITDRVPVYEDYDQFGREGHRNVIDNAEWSAHYAKFIFLECESNAMDHALRLTTAGTGLWQFSEDARNLLAKALAHARRIASDQSLSPTDEVFYDEWLTLRRAYVDYLESRSRLTLLELRKLVREMLDNAETGTDKGLYPQEAIERLRSQLNDRKILKTKDEYLDLEQSYMAFLEQKERVEQD